MAKKLIAVIDIGSLTARIKIFEVNAKASRNIRFIISFDDTKYDCYES